MDGARWASLPDGLRSEAPALVPFFWRIDPALRGHPPASKDAHHSLPMGLASAKASSSKLNARLFPKSEIYPLVNAGAAENESLR